MSLGHHPVLKVTNGDVESLSPSLILIKWKAFWRSSVVKTEAQTLNLNQLMEVIVYF